MIGSAPAWPLVAHAQQLGRPHRVGFLWDSPNASPDTLAAFRQELRRLGYVEGQNLVIELRWSEGKPERMRDLAEELARLPVDLIVAPTSVYTAAAMAATGTIPIVFLAHADPLRTGHVASLANPGGNVTGVSMMMTETNVKSLELLKEAIPRLARVALLFDPATPSHLPGVDAAVAAGPRLQLTIQPVPVSSASEFEEAFAGISRGRAEAVLVLLTPIFIAGARPLAELGMKYRLPTVHGHKDNVTAGGFMSYSPDRPDLWRRGAGYVDSILRGAPPGSLAVQQPTKFELVINLKTAKALGLMVPQSLLARADEVIE